MVGTIVTFTLCEDFAFLLKDYLDKHENGPAIFLLHRAKIKEARGAYAISIQNSMYGFRVFINEDLKDIEDYKNGLDPSQLNLVTFSQRMSEISYSSQITSEDRFLYNAQVKPLSEHWELKKVVEMKVQQLCLGSLFQLEVRVAQPNETTNFTLWDKESATFRFKAMPNNTQYSMPQISDDEDLIISILRRLPANEVPEIEPEMSDLSMKKSDDLVYTVMTPAKRELVVSKSQLEPVPFEDLPTIQLSSSKLSKSFFEVILKPVWVPCRTNVRLIEVILEEDYKEIKMALVRANIEEDTKDTMTHFLSGLNPNIRDVVELQEYVELDDLLHKAILVEQQLKRKIVATRNSSNNFNQNWTNRSKKEGDNSSNPHGKSVVPSAETKHNSASSSNTGTRNIKCLGRGHSASDCPTRRTMIMKADGAITSESEISEEEEEEAKEELEEEAMQGDMLMVRRLLGSQMQPQDNTQRENILHTRCTINGKLCSLIVDGGSCTNVASSSEDEEVKVTQQVEVCLTIGRYNDRVLYDVCDTKAVHDDFTNKISFQHHDWKIILKPLSPREVCDDQIRMREKREQEREKSEVPKRNRKKKSDSLERKSDTHDRKSDTHERKFNCVAKTSEVRKIHYMYGFCFQLNDFWHLIKFGESFSLSFLLNQSQTYQGNPCGVYHDLSSLSGSGVIQNFVTCIKRSAPSKLLMGTSQIKLKEITYSLYSWAVKAKVSKFWYVVENIRDHQIGKFHMILFDSEVTLILNLCLMWSY
ncbi:hypothetical protein HKD37_17G047937 [Glycine soja]